MKSAGWRRQVNAWGHGLPAKIVLDGVDTHTHTHSTWKQGHGVAKGVRGKEKHNSIGPDQNIRGIKTK